MISREPMEAGWLYDVGADFFTVFGKFNKLVRVSKVPKTLKHKKITILHYNVYYFNSLNIIRSENKRLKMILLFYLRKFTKSYFYINFKTNINVYN